MRDKVMGQVPEILGQSITAAWEEDGKAHIALSGGRKLVCDHVFAATGYRMDLSRLSFLGASMRQAIARTGGTLNVSPGFETDLPGLYALGPLTMENFGPLLRFVCGTSFAAPRLARVLKRRVLVQRIEDRVLAAARALAQRFQDAIA
jgi:FAD-dependent urate hydroxylase